MQLEKNQQEKNLPLWQAPKDFNINPIYETKITKLGKSNHNRVLAMTDKTLILIKDNKVHKILPLDFTTKFEVIRDAPILKQSAGGKKPPSTTQTNRLDIVKPEEIQQLGDILYIRLSAEHTDKTWDFSADQDTLRKWRQLFGLRINQMGFHHMFKVFKKIGKGNFASVYLAERVDDGTQMAIKAFSKSAVYAEENGKEGLINEIQLMRELNHPNIMKLYEVYETQNSLYMGLELLQGGQLYEYMKKKVIFQNKEIQQIMNGLLDGLAHMHSKGIMHRDIKLENILFKESNNLNSVVIADFGLATQVDAPVYLYCRCGTPGFVAPEVINITDMTTTYDSVCDVYSLGLVFHILLTGKPGFPGKSYNTIVQQNKEAKINFKSPVFEVVQPQAFELLKQMLEPNPKKRITAKLALKNDYIMAGKEKVVEVEQQVEDENINEENDIPDLGSRMAKINKESDKFDMLRINQLTNSPIKSPVMQATDRLKMGKNTDKHEDMIMKTPVITGRLQSVEESPQQLGQFMSPAVNFKNLRQQQPEQKVNPLSKYTQKPNQQQQEQPEVPKDNLVKNIKAALSKNV
ncbi:hypothetical protein pb186bvf_006760 [Paramecium bursaria]